VSATGCTNRNRPPETSATASEGLSGGRTLTRTAPRRASTTETFGVRSGSTSGIWTAAVRGRTVMVPRTGATPTVRSGSGAGNVPVPAIRRIRPLPESATSTAPSAATVSAAGESSDARLAGPPSPPTPRRPPATVKTAPSGVMRRRRSVPASAISRPPFSRGTTSVGADSPVERSDAPSAAKPRPRPAICVIVPSGARRRIRPPPVSAIRRPPSAVGVTPRGPVSPAARVVMMPFWSTRRSRPLPESTTR